MAEEMEDLKDSVINEFKIKERELLMKLNLRDKNIDDSKELVKSLIYRCEIVEKKLNFKN